MTLFIVGLALAVPRGGPPGALDSSAKWQPRSLQEIWETYAEAPLLDHWLEYAEHYETHFPKPDGKTPLKLLEIGVQSGGSARTWKQYYGEPLTYVGVDINEPCKRSESPAEKIFVEIGSQLDGVFLESVCDKHGPFDMVVDDGGHSGAMMNYSLSTIFAHSSCLTSKATYVIEDMHTMAMCGQGYCTQPSDVHRVVSQTFLGMHSHWFKSEDATYNGEAVPPAWAEEVRSMALYDSMAFFKRGAPISALRRIVRGTDQIPYGDGDAETRKQAAP